MAKIAIDFRSPVIQHFGGALNLNIHFHRPFLNGVYVDHPNGAARFCRVKAPNSPHRALITPTKRGKGNKARVAGEPPTPAGIPPGPDYS